MVRAAKVAMQRYSKHASTTIERLRLVCGLCRGATYVEGNWGFSCVTEYPSDSNDVITEAGQPSLLGFVTRKRLMKTFYMNSHY